MHRHQIQSLVPGLGVTALMGMGIEGILTFNLIFVGLVACDPKLKPNNVIGGLVTGFAIGTGVMVAVRILIFTFGGVPDLGLEGRRRLHFISFNLLVITF